MGVGVEVGVGVGVRVCVEVAEVIFRRKNCGVEVATLDWVVGELNRYLAVAEESLSWKRVVVVVVVVKMTNYYLLMEMVERPGVREMAVTVRVVMAMMMELVMTWTVVERLVKVESPATKLSQKAKTFYGHQLPVAS
jgi:hypothetical protein